MKEYPILKIPKSLQVKFDKNLLVPEKPVLPIKPGGLIVAKHGEVAEDKGCLGAFETISIIALMIGVVLLLIGLLSSDDGESLGLGLMLIFAFGFIVHFFISSEKKETNRENNRRKNAFLKEMEEYEKVLLPKFNNEYEVYKSKVKLLENDILCKKIQNDEFRLNLLKSKKPEKIEGNFKKGITEEFFLGILQQCYGEKILVDSSIKSPNDNWVFVPDFVYFDKANNFIIEIEIDEPYVGSTLEPIHFIDGSDDSRDDYFLSHNWIVLRFAEEQIVTNPYGCCNIISKVVNYFFQKQEDYFFAPELTQIKRWTSNEAEIMAFSKHRNTYLEDSQLPFLIQEQKRSKRKFNKRSKNSNNVQDDLPF